MKILANSGTLLVAGNSRNALRHLNLTIFKWYDKLKGSKVRGTKSVNRRISLTELITFTYYILKHIYIVQNKEPILWFINEMLILSRISFSSLLLVIVFYLAFLSFSSSSGLTRRCSRCLRRTVWRIVIFLAELCLSEDLIIAAIFSYCCCILVCSLLKQWIISFEH